MDKGSKWFTADRDKPDRDRGVLHYLLRGEKHEDYRSVDFLYLGIPGGLPGGRPGGAGSTGIRTDGVFVSAKSEAIGVASQHITRFRIRW